MKQKGIIAIFLFSMFSIFGWGQSFDLPEVTNTADSVEESFRALIEITARLGSPEHKSDWTYSEAIMIKDFTAYLDSVLKNLSRDSVKNYIALIRKKIDTIDISALSKNRQRGFEHFLSHANSYWVSNALGKYQNRPFPPEIPLNYNTALITEFDETMKNNEARLVEYKAKLAETPTLDDIRAKLDANLEEQKKPDVKKDKKRLQELKAEEERMRTGLSNTFINRDNLTNAIRKLENILKSVDSARMSLVESVENPERQKYLDILESDMAIFSTWENFFSGKNNRLREFLILIKAKESLFRMLDEIPQNQAQIYQAKLDDFCVGWGL
jgi:hypothetical protein